MKFRVRSGKQGLELRLHELEASIMDIVWSQRLTKFAVSAVLDVLGKRREIAYTTVMTTLARLAEKGLLSRELDGKRYLYSARITREAFLESTAREVLNQSVNEQQAMAMLSEKVAQASVVELDNLEARIRLRRKELKQ